MEFSRSTRVRDPYRLERPVLQNSTAYADCTGMAQPVEIDVYSRRASCPDGTAVKQYRHQRFWRLPE
jgi:hypothetical protein